MKAIAAPRKKKTHAAAAAAAVILKLDLHCVHRGEPEKDPFWYHVHHNRRCSIGLPEGTRITVLDKTWTWTRDFLNHDAVMIPHDSPFWYKAVERSRELGLFYNDKNDDTVVVRMWPC